MNNHFVINVIKNGIKKSKDLKIPSKNLFDYFVMFATFMINNVLFVSFRDDK